MCSPVRFSSVASGVLLGLLAVGPVEAQSLRVNGSTSSTVPAAPDYAAEVKGDPWDFDKSSDYVYTYSLGEDTPQDNVNEYTAWEPYPTVQNGIFSGVTREQTPSLQMLFGGVPGAMNARQDTGLQTPIDAGRYVTLSFRVKRSWAAANTEALRLLWEKGRACTFTPVGVLLLLAKGFDNDTARWINQNPIGQPGQCQRVAGLSGPADRPARARRQSLQSGDARGTAGRGPQRLARQRTRRQHGADGLGAR